MIAVVDYGMGNLRSVAKSLEAIGQDVCVTTSARDLRDATHIVLPGVGSFDRCADNLRASGLVDALHEEVQHRKKPFLGICVGMQLLAERGDEGSGASGLGWIKGRVQRLPDDSGVKVPHVGWNDIAVDPGDPLFQGVRHPVFYFVHSYFLTCAASGVVTSTCDYGVEFAATVSSDNIVGVQFHPEKSQQNGLRFLQNFVARN
jgi:glutamine amidotransferase